MRLVSGPQSAQLQMKNNEMDARKWIFLNNNGKFISSNINFTSSASDSYVLCCAAVLWINLNGLAKI